MAIKKKSDMQMSQFEKPITTPEISQESTASQNNDDIFDHSDPKQDTPITDPGLEQELHILQDLKEAQLNVTDSSEAIRHLAGTKTSVIYYNQVQLQVNGDTINVTSGTDAEPVVATFTDASSGAEIVSSDIDSKYMMFITDQKTAVKFDDGNVLYYTGNASRGRTDKEVICNGEGKTVIVFEFNYAY